MKKIFFISSFLVFSFFHLDAFGDSGGHQVEKMYGGKCLKSENIDSDWVKDKCLSDYFDSGFLKFFWSENILCDISSHKILLNALPLHRFFLDIIGKVKNGNEEMMSGTTIEQREKCLDDLLEASSDLEEEISAFEEEVSPDLNDHQPRVGTRDAFNLVSSGTSCRNQGGSVPSMLRFPNSCEFKLHDKPNNERGEVVGTVMFFAVPNPSGPQGPQDVGKLTVKCSSSEKNYKHKKRTINSVHNDTRSLAGSILWHNKSPRVLKPGTVEGDQIIYRAASRKTCYLRGYDDDRKLSIEIEFPNGHPFGGKFFYYP